VGQEGWSSGSRGWGSWVEVWAWEPVELPGGWGRGVGAGLELRGVRELGAGAGGSWGSSRGARGGWLPAHLGWAG
jgi:hypothetical protein